MNNMNYSQNCVRYRGISQDQNESENKTDHVEI